MNIYNSFEFQLHMHSSLAKGMHIQDDQNVQMNIDRHYMSLKELISEG